jgi:putative pyruvate formate lyase activating enzyme
MVRFADMSPLSRPDFRDTLSKGSPIRGLGRYLDVTENRKTAKFLISKKLRADFDPSEPESVLWELHRELAEKYRSLEDALDKTELSLADLSSPPKSYLDLKVDISKRLLTNCRLCERMERVDRTAGKTGFCKCGRDIAVSSFFAHNGEEPELVPSGTIFTLGCTLRCLYCQNWSISQMFEPGKKYSSAELAKIVETLRVKGCRNVNLVGGEPTPWLRDWLEVFRLVFVNVPVIWNSNAYYSPLTADLLGGFVDLFLLDFKYGPGDCSERLSNAPGYWKACTRNHLQAMRSGELIVRVLVLPGHLECCTEKILEWINRNLGPDTRINLMFQFRPEWRAADVPELGRRLTRAEMKRALEVATEIGLRNLVA